MARVLVVDDAAFMRKMLGDALSKGGHEVVGEAGNGVEAVDRFRDLKPDVTTLDITMPEKDGLAALKEILTLDPAARVVMFTMSSNISSQAALRGAEAVVTKDDLPDPANVNIQTRLNGKVMQDANTDDLVFSVVQLIEYYSQFYLFRPGDVITTGSPSGVGFGRNPKVFMKPGDVVEVEVKAIGVLRNPIEA